VTVKTGTFPVYNCEVEGTHTYYIANIEVLVHNVCTLHGYLRRVPTENADIFRRITRYMDDNQLLNTRLVSRNTNRVVEEELQTRNINYTPPGWGVGPYILGFFILFMIIWAGQFI
jgi:hypothetical protein